MNYILQKQDAFQKEINGRLVTGDRNAVYAFEQLAVKLKQDSNLTLTLTDSSKASLRSEAEQAEIARTEKWGNKFSRHMSGLAFDVALYRDGKRLADSEFNRIMAYLDNTGVLSSYGFGKWGGHFKKYDPIHIEFTGQTDPNAQHIEIGKSIDVAGASAQSQYTPEINSKAAVDNTNVFDELNYDPQKSFFENVSCGSMGIEKLHKAISPLDHKQLRAKIAKHPKLGKVLARSFTNRIEKVKADTKDIRKEYDYYPIT